MQLSRNQTKMLQGIAILCMFGLHLFNRTEIQNFYDVKIFTGGVPLLTIISYSFDACVPIYLFCSGYGLFKNYIGNKEAYYKKNLNRLMKLMFQFWIVMSITCLVGYLYGMRDIYPGTLINFILNALLIRSSYVGAFWFMQTYALLVLSSKYIYKFIKSYDYKIISMISLLLYGVAFLIERKVMPSLTGFNLEIINILMLLLRSQFSFVIGAIMANENKIDENKFISKIRNHKILIIICCLIIVAIRGFVLRSMVFAPFSAIAFIVLLGQCDYSNITKRMLLFFGKHSTNMWLTHMQFYMIFTPRLIFGSRNIFIIFLTLILVTILSSIIINLIMKVLNRFILQFNI